MTPDEPFIPVLLRTTTGTRRYYVRGRDRARKLPNFVAFDRSPTALAHASKLNAGRATPTDATGSAPATAGPKGTTGAGAPPPPRRTPTTTKAGERTARKKVTPRKSEYREADFGHKVRVLPAATYSTWFKAFGTVGDTLDLAGFISPEYKEDLALADHPTERAPALWYSNKVLGPVKYEGVKPEKRLVGLLNKRLQYRGESRRGFDFRDAYPDWEYRYSVVEHIGDLDRVLVDVVRSSRDG